jgi:protein SDA1
MSEDLLRDLVEYKTYKSKAVMMASRGLIQLFRTNCPELLHKRDRGRPTEAMLDTRRKEFGETEVVDFVPGAEVVDGEENESEDDEEGESDEDEEDGNDEEKILSLEEKKAKAREMTVGKILTDEDFKKIDAAQLKKQVVGVRMGGKKGTKRSAAEAELDSDEEADGGGRKELVNLADIEMIHKKKKHDKEV